MTHITRRTLVRSATAAAAAGTFTGPALLDWAKAWAQTAPWQPERGAQLSLLRWKYFVQAEDDAFVKMLDAFTKATGVTVTMARESFEDVQPKASVVANTGAGPDLFWGLHSLPHLFPQKCIDVTDVADYLGRKYGGWAPSAIAYGKSGNTWIAIPVCCTGVLMNYRISSMNKAGFAKFPQTTDEFLAYAKATKADGAPGGFALGHASGDANAWVYWCLWAFGGNLVDRNDKVIVDSPETEKAMNFAKQLYEAMIPGVAAWNDASNNKAFLAGEIHWTANGISIYAGAKANPASNVKVIADDMDHAYWPIGPVGKPTELHTIFPILAMSHTKYPQACKALLAFMMEADNFNPWIEAASGYLSPSLAAYEANPVWMSDPKRTLFRDVATRSLTVGGLGSVGEKAASAIADFVLVDMFASYCIGREDAKGAMRTAERQLQRIYR
jgi:multiple sugar transport system substrate-binding protein